MAATPQGDFDKEHLRRRLGAASAGVEMLEALQAAGVSPAQLSSAAGVSREAVRRWTHGAAIRDANAQVLRDLLRILVTLLENDAFEPSDAVRWLVKPVSDRAPAPLDLVREHPDAVVAAARAAAQGMPDDAVAQLEQIDAPSSDDSNDVTPSATPSELSSTTLNGRVWARMWQVSANRATTAREALDTLKREVRPGVERIPNYVSTRELLDRLEEELRAGGDGPAADSIIKVAAEDSFHEANIKAWAERCGRQIIDCPKTILTYAASVRVVQTLRGALTQHQRESTLYIAECRPKSAPPRGLERFADAADTLHQLHGTAYQTYVVLDAIAMSLLALDDDENGDGDVRRPDILLLGAQVVYEDPPTSFSATAGTRALIELARARGIEVVVVAEKSKQTSAPPPSAAEFKSRKRKPEVRLRPDTKNPDAGATAILLTMSDELCPVTADVDVMLLDGKRSPSSGERTALST